MVQTLKVLLLSLVSAAALAQPVPPTPTCTITTVPTQGVGMVDVTVNWTTTDAVLCTASGAWSGQKLCGSGSQVFSDITQSRTFNMTAKSANGKFGLKWTKPNKNTDGTPTTISGFKLYKATTPAGVLTASPLLLGPDVLEYVAYLAPGPESGGVKAVRTDSVDSEMSNIITKTVVALQGTCTATVIVTSRPNAPTLSMLVDKVKSWFGS